MSNVQNTKLRAVHKLYDAESNDRWPSDLLGDPDLSLSYLCDTYRLQLVWNLLCRHHWPLRRPCPWPDQLANGPPREHFLRPHPGHWSKREKRKGHVTKRNKYIHLHKQGQKFLASNLWISGTKSPKNTKLKMSWKTTDMCQVDVLWERTVWSTNQCLCNN